MTSSSAADAEDDLAAVASDLRFATERRSAVAARPVRLRTMTSSATWRRALRGPGARCRADPRRSDRRGTSPTTGRRAGRRRTPWSPPTSWPSRSSPGGSSSSSRRRVRARSCSSRPSLRLPRGVATPPTAAAKAGLHFSARLCSIGSPAPACRCRFTFWVTSIPPSPRDGASCSRLRPARGRPLGRGRARPPRSTSAVLAALLARVVFVLRLLAVADLPTTGF